jgi:hypothetical protein
MFEEYQYLLFESEKEEDKPLIYQKQIDDINKFFSWDILALKMSDNNPLIMKEIYKMMLQDILDYLVVSKQSAKIEEYKNSKNMLPL